MKGTIVLPAAFNNQAFTAVALHFLTNDKPLPPEIFKAKPPSHPLSQLLLMLQTEEALDSFLDAQSRHRQHFEKAVLAGLFFRAYYDSLLSEMSIAELTAYLLPRFKASLAAVADCIADRDMSVDDAFTHCYQQYGALLMANKKDFAPFVIQRLIQGGKVAATDSRLEGFSTIATDFERCWQERGLVNFIQAVTANELVISLEDIEPLLNELSLLMVCLGDEGPKHFEADTLYLGRDADAKLTMSLSQESFAKKFSKDFSFYQFYCKAGDVFAVGDTSRGFLLPALTASTKPLSVLTQTIERLAETTKSEACYEPLKENVQIEFDGSSDVDLEAIFRQLLRKNYFAQQTQLTDMPEGFIGDWVKAQSGKDILQLQEDYLDYIDVQKLDVFIKGYQCYYQRLIAYVHDRVTDEMDKKLSLQSREAVIDFMSRLEEDESQSEAVKLKWLALLDGVMTCSYHEYEQVTGVLFKLAAEARFEQQSQPRIKFFSKPSLKSDLVRLAHTLRQELPLVERLNQLSDNFPELRGSWVKRSPSVLTLAYANLSEAMANQQKLSVLFAEVDIEVGVRQVPGTKLYELTLTNVSYDKLAQLERVVATKGRP